MNIELTKNQCLFLGEICSKINVPIDQAAAVIQLRAILLRAAGIKLNKNTKENEKRTEKPKPINTSKPTDSKP